MIAFLLLVHLSVIFGLGDNHNGSLVTEQTRRVYYGEAARIEDYPYFAGLWNCGAAILSEIWIATAAHCVNDAEHRGPKLVYVGGNTIQDSLAITYTDFFIHPQYNVISSVSINDIALLKLNAPLRFSQRIQPAKLPASDAPWHTVLVTRGSDETGKASISLKKVDRIILPPKDCFSLMSNPQDIVNFALQNRNQLDRMILCTRRKQNLASVCLGDSGSPLLNGNILIGIHTYGNKYCEQGKVGIETYVLNFVPWIKSITGL